MKGKIHGNERKLEGNEIPYIHNLVRKTNYNTNTIEIKTKIATNHDNDKYITTQEFDKLTSENFTTRLRQTNLASKCDIDKFVEKTDFYNKLKVVISNTNELNELSIKVKAILTKGLIKYLMK